jgi:hypothetical protein
VGSTPIGHANSSDKYSKEKNMNDQELEQLIRSGNIDPKEITDQLFPGLSGDDLKRAIKHAKEALIREGCGEISPETRAEFFRNLPP